MAARYGDGALDRKVHVIHFLYRGHEYMSEEEKRAQTEALAAAMGGKKP